MTLPKETPPPNRGYVSERYTLLVEMIKIAHKAFSSLVPLIGEEMEREEVDALRNRNRRLLKIKQ